jgi:hypothetical protein
VTKREQDPLELQGIRVEDQERLRSLGAGCPCLAGGVSGQGRHDVYHRTVKVPGPVEAQARSPGS